MKVAVIGIGVIGKVHLSVLKEKGIKPVAICDIDEEKLLGYPDLKGYTDYREMIDREKPDVVHVCTPHYLHAEMIIYALERDINVLTEKPLAISEGQIKNILRAEEKSKAKLGVCFQNRYNSVSRYVKKWLEGKEIEGIYANVAWTRDEKYYNSAEWRGTKKYEGGGVLINQAIHTIDLANWFSGGYKTVKAVCSNLSLSGVIEVEDTASALCTGKSKMLLTASVASPFDSPVSITVKTDKGTALIVGNELTIDGKKVEVTPVYGYYGKECYGYGHLPLIDDFYDCIESGKDFMLNGKEGAKALRIVLACYKSNGQTVEI